jgi:hypothetical protein
MDHSRNLEVVLRDAAIAQQVAALHRQVWNSPYAAVIDVQKDYPKPIRGNAQ